jgi:sirohydrochlorin ferrochelatase
MLSESLRTALDAGLDPSASRLLVVGHGSKFGPRSAEATRAAAARIEQTRRFATVATAFLEEAPFLQAELPRENIPTVVTGFFFGDGMHAGEDVPAAIRETAANAVYAGPLGRSARIPALIAAALRAEAEARRVH